MAPAQTENKLSPIELSLFASRITAVCEEMGAVLRRAAFSPNIRDRLDFSCAVFDADGALSAQAAHIPVHLGSMAYAMADIVGGIDWNEGDMIVLNDPYLGGTHLPDVTVIAPVYVDGQIVAFVVNRAHHADIGSDSPGSMPTSTRLEEEGLIIPPKHLLRGGEIDQAAFSQILDAMKDEAIARGDFSAQISANRLGMARVRDLVSTDGIDEFQAKLKAYNDYAARLAAEALDQLPPGDYECTDTMDDDGAGNEDLPIRCRIKVGEQGIRVDFTGSAEQVAGNINCPLPVTAAAVYYVFRCLMPAQAPDCAGSFRHIDIKAPQGCLLNAQRPHAVAAGNVETSSRIVDAVLGALARALPDKIPAASQGSMNNLAMGSHAGESVWDYYETMGGGTGAGAQQLGCDAVQSHMTNTLNTPIEVLELNFPLRVWRYAVRRGSGGGGRHAGGDGLVREFEFLDGASVTLLTERRKRAPWGLNGGEDGQPGENRLNDELLDPKVTVEVKAGDRLSIATPGGGGWG